MNERPKVILRLGSHAEKEYFEKLAKSLDAMLFASNLLEITPAATSSLLLGMRTRRGDDPLPFYLDPMTYMFGPYIDPKTKKRRADLDSLKSEQAKSKGSKEKVRRVKQSYVKVAEQLGSVFKKSVANGKAVDPIALSSKERNDMCRAVTEYQLNRIPDILSGDEFMQQYADHCAPEAVFAPYFYIADEWADDGVETAVDLAKRTVHYAGNHPVHAVIVASLNTLSSRALRTKIVTGLKESGVAGTWLWFNGFDELEAEENELRSFRKLVRRLGKSGDVFNRHGGLFSLLLHHDGLTGISHGVGYGERKKVAQVIGAAAPVVRYYLPAIAKRVGVPAIQRCFPHCDIATPEDFFESVCGCTICRGVIGDDIERFQAFGEMHKANSKSKRDSQTPAAAKMCRYHFLINRMGERGTVANLSASGRSKFVTECASGWREAPPLRDDLGAPAADGYLERWSKVLKDEDN